MDAVIVLFVTLCPLNADTCYKTIEAKYASMEECYVELSVNLDSASLTRQYQCITEREAQTLIASTRTD
jgi:hypothetical protein